MSDRRSIRRYTRNNLGPLRPRGFTLVELSIVVVIVGILATLAVVGYRRIVTSAHTAEATQMVNAIRVAQESFKGETGTYANITGKIVVNTWSNETYPHTSAPSNYKLTWGAPCSATQCPNAASGFTWDTFPIHVDGPVMYGYSTEAGIGGTGPTDTAQINGSTLSFPATPVRDWFIAAAIGNPDGDSTPKYSSAVGASFSSDVFIDREGD